MSSAVSPPAPVAADLLCELLNPVRDNTCVQYLLTDLLYRTEKLALLTSLRGISAALSTVRLAVSATRTNSALRSLMLKFSTLKFSTCFDAAVVLRPGPDMGSLRGVYRVCRKFPGRAYDHNVAMRRKESYRKEPHLLAALHKAAESKVRPSPW